VPFVAHATVYVLCMEGVEELMTKRVEASVKVEKGLGK
jgi:hypothetical protein